MTWLLQVLTRFVPGLVPAIGGLLNPWILLALGAAISGAFLYGLSVGHDRLEAFEARVAAAGEIQEARSAERVARDRLNKERVDREHERTVEDLGDRIAALVGRLSGSDPRGSLLPAAGAGAQDPERIAFDRAELDRALRGFAARAGGLVGEGATAVEDLNAARRWNLERLKSDGQGN